MSASVGIYGEAVVTSAKAAAVKVFDALGACMHAASVDAGTSRFTLDLEPGIYMMQVEDAAGAGLTVKFVIK